MTATPDGLSPGPDGTFYGPLSCVPDDWEYRYSADGKWDGYDREGSDRAAIVQARPAPLGPPTGIRFDDAIVTVWGEMRDRPDLDQWEYARAGPHWPGWCICDATPRDTPGYFPLVVRRRRDGDQ